jgi:uncharacterized protein YcfJ
MLEKSSILLLRHRIPAPVISRCKVIGSWSSFRRHVSEAWRCARKTMKRSVFALPLMLLSSIPVSAAPYTVYDYDPAYLDQPYRRAPRHSQARSNRGVYVNNQDPNSCLEGSVIGGLLGAGLGAVLSRGNGRWVGVPVGGAAGALLGCQVDGG